MSRRVAMAIQLRQEGDGTWYVDRKATNPSGSFVRWQDSKELTPEEVLTAAEALGLGERVKAIFRAWARDSAQQARTAEAELVRGTGALHADLAAARDRASKAALAVTVLVGPDPEELG